MAFFKKALETVTPYGLMRKYHREGAASSKHERKNKREVEKFSKKQKDDYKKFLKQDRADYEKHLAQARSDYKKYAKESKHPFHGLKGKERKKMEKKYYGAVEKAMKGKHIKYERLDKQQRKLLDELAHGARKDIEHMPKVKDVTKPTETAEFRAGSKALQDILGGTSEEGFKKYKEGAMSEFREGILPAVAERFAGSQSAGIKSSAFQNAMTDAAKMLETHLASQKEGMRVQNEQLRLNATGPALTYSQMPLHQAASLREMAMGGVPNALAADRYMQAYIPPVIPGLPQMPTPFSAPGYSNPAPYQAAPPMLTPARPGGLHSFLGAVGGPAAQGLGAGIGYGMGGPIGGALGAGIGGGISNMFSGGGGAVAGGYAPNANMPALPQNFGARMPAFNPQYSMRYPGL